MDLVVLVLMLVVVADVAGDDVSDAFWIWWICCYCW